MHTAKLGESFEQPFTMYDDRDKTKTVGSATFEVVVEEETVQSGAMSIDEDGHTCSFRFLASNLGVHAINIQYTIGDDTWRCTFLMNVVA